MFLKVLTKNPKLTAAGLGGSAAIITPSVIADQRGQEVTKLEKQLEEAKSEFEITEIELTQKVEDLGATVKEQQDEISILSEEKEDYKTRHHMGIVDLLDNHAEYNQDRKRLIDLNTQLTKENERLAEDNQRLTIENAQLNEADKINKMEISDMENERFRTYEYEALKKDLKEEIMKTMGEDWWRNVSAGMVTEISEEISAQLSAGGVTVEVDQDVLQNIILEHRLQNMDLKMQQLKETNEAIMKIVKKINDFYPSAVAVWTSEGDSSLTE